MPCSLSFAGELATPEEAEAMVSKAANAINIDRDATFKEITSKDIKWVKGDLYPVVYDMDGKCLAHGHLQMLVGKDLIGAKDPDGREYIKERVQLAKTKEKFWQEYKVLDPVGRRVALKSFYCEKTGDVIVCAGIGKR